MPDVFSIVCTFRVDMSQIENLTNLLEQNRESREVTLTSSVSPESFALFCRHLNGEEIRVTKSNVSDMRLLGREMM